jgi:hypothetical protein
VHMLIYCTTEVYRHSVSLNYTYSISNSGSIKQATMEVTGMHALLMQWIIGAE